MADIIQKIKAFFDGSDAEAGAEKLGRSMTGSFLKADLAATALKKTLTLVHGEIVKGLDSYVEYERTTLRLSAALNTNIENGDKWLDVLQRQASILQEQTGISDETIRQYQGIAVNAGISADKVDDMVRATISLSNATGKELRPTFEALLNVQKGSVEELAKYIPELKGAKKENIELADVLQIVTERMGDQLGLLKTGLGGSETSLSRAWEDLTESFINIIVVGTPLVQLLGDIAGTISEINTSIGSGNLTDMLTLAAVGDVEGIANLMGANKKLSEQELRLAKATAGKGKNKYAIPDPDGKGKGKGKGKEKPGFDFGSFDEISGWTMTEQGWETEAAVDARIDRNKKMNEELERIEKESAEKRARINAELAATQAQIDSDTFSRKMRMQGMLVDMGVGAAFALAEGGAEAAGAMVVSALKSNGQQLIADGIKNVLMGSAMASNPVTAPFGAATIAAGQQEMLVGALMAAGGFGLGAAGVGKPSGGASATTSYSSGAGGSYGGGFGGGFGGGGGGYGGGGSFSYTSTNRSYSPGGGQSMGSMPTFNVPSGMGTMSAFGKFQSQEMYYTTAGLYGEGPRSTAGKVLWAMANPIGFMQTQAMNAIKTAYDWAKPKPPTWKEAASGLRGTRVRLGYGNGELMESRLRAFGGGAVADDRAVVIEVRGPMSPEETGVWVRDAMRAAERGGRL